MKVLSTGIYFEFLHNCRYAESNKEPIKCIYTGTGEIYYNESAKVILKIKG